MTTVGSLVYHFFEHHLKAEKGLSQASIRSYRDGIRLFLFFIAETTGHPISKLALSDLNVDNVRAFLTHLEGGRGNNIRSRNHRLAMLHTFFAYVGGQAPELLHQAERVAAIPRKRAQPPATRYLERDEIDELFAKLPRDGRLAARDRALLLFLYNTGARASEVVDLTIGRLVLAPPPRVNLHGKGDKWRTCPLWPETARMMQEMLQSRRQTAVPSGPVFLSNVGKPLTRFGLYKLVRRHTGHIPVGENQRVVSPHVLRHTTAVHLLEFRRRPQRHQGLARSRLLGYDQSLRRDQHPDETRSPRGMPGSFDFFGGTSPTTSLAERTEAPRMACSPLIIKQSVSKCIFLLTRWVGCDSFSA